MSHRFRALKSAPALVVAAALGTLATGATAGIASEKLVAVPFVGCRSDGQLGPQPAPRKPREIIRVPGKAAGELAFYESDEMGVLAPRGWRCIGLSGSNGSILIVTPEQPGEDSFRIKGPAVQLTFSVGDTSGRFEAAKIAARLFPSRRAFVEGVIGEGIEPATAFPLGPPATDAVKRYGDNAAEFVTPAGAEGLGTMSRLVKSDLPISGAATIDSENNVLTLDVRLPPRLQHISRSIVESVRKGATQGGG